MWPSLQPPKKKYGNTGADIAKAGEDLGIEVFPA